MQTPSWTLDRIINILLYLGGIALFLWLLNYLSPYLVSFFLAWFTAYLLEPIVKFCQLRLKIPWRWAAVFITLLLITSLLTLTGLVVVPAITAELFKINELLGGSLSMRYETLVPEELRQQIADYLESDELKSLLTEDNLSSLGSKLLSYLWAALSGAVGIVLGLFSLVTYLLYLVFIMAFYHEFTDHWESAVPPAYRHPVVTLVTDVEAGMQIYFRGQALVVFWVSLFFALGFGLIGLPLGVFFGLFVGLLNFIPYLQIVGLPPALVLAGIQAMETGQSFWGLAGLVLLVFAVVQLIQEAVLVPRIMGNATGLNPAVILLALSIWGGLFGVIGMIIALPMTSLLINYYKRFVLEGQDIRDL